MKEYTIITMSTREYPIRFDYMVLEKVAEKYKNISKFEMELLGLGKITDEKGKEVLTKTKEPSISCLMFVLPIMVSSALDYLGLEQIDDKEIIRDIDLNYYELAGIIHSEMRKCFKSAVVEKKKIT